METHTLDQIIKDICISNRVPIHTFSRGDANLEDIDFHFREELFANYKYTSLFDEMTSPICPEAPVIDYEDSFNAHYIVYQNDESTYTFIGPYLIYTFTSDEFGPIVERNKLTISHFKEVNEFLLRISEVKDILVWESTLLSLLIRRFERHITFTRVESPLHTHTNAKTNARILIPHSVAAFSAIEARYAVENALLEAVSKGDSDEAIRRYNQFMGFRIEPRMDDELRNAKDMVIAVNTLLRKAIEQAFVHPLYIDNINKRMTAEIENVKNVGQLNTLCASMIRRYCLLVQSHSRIQYSDLVRKSLDYIDFHYSEPLSLAHLSEFFNVTKNYLSSLFHSEVGQTLTDYINETRIKRAILLLNTTDRTIQDIADSCGFADANYFARSFKKYQGISPTAYRKSIH